jgi:hypothetical protein
MYTQCRQPANRQDGSIPNSGKEAATGAVIRELHRTQDSVSSLDVSVPQSPAQLRLVPSHVG